MNNAPVVMLACLLLTGCPSKEKPTPSLQLEELTRRAAGQVASAPVEVEYEKRLSDTETIRGLRIPYSGNIFLGGVDDVRCLLYVNDAYKTTQIICPDSAERYPRDEAVETGTDAPIN